MYKIENICSHIETTRVCIDGEYLPARPIPFDGWLHRLKDAYAVLTGKADAVKWPKQ